MDTTVEKEKLVNAFIDQGNKNAAVKLLFELAVAYARKRDFKTAEAMRSRIFEIDPMALNEIVTAADIIEEEKHKTINRTHRQIWTKLYQSLSVAEANAIYFSLKRALYRTGEIISSQGELKPRLYFIERGQVKVVYHKYGGEEIFLKTVNPGQLAGEDTFFYFSVCTTSIVALCETELSYLDSDVLRVWATTAPGLEYKLQSFSEKKENIPDLLKAKAADRRRMKRIFVSGKANANLMNEAGKEVGKPFRVNMGDVSRGGACVYVKIPKKETASLLLGKKLQISYLPPGKDSSYLVKRIGTIVALRFNPFEDCTVSLKFDSLLPETMIQELEQLGPPTKDLDQLVMES